MKLAKKIVITICGLLLLAVGVIAMPYPGPGFLIILIGLAILAKEYEFAERWLTKGERAYESWKAWLGRQNVIVGIIFFLVAAAVGLAMLWLMNGLSPINRFFDLNMDWMNSPLPFFR